MKEDPTAGFALRGHVLRDGWFYPSSANLRREEFLSLSLHFSPWFRFLTIANNFNLKDRCKSFLLCPFSGTYNFN